MREYISKMAAFILTALPPILICFMDGRYFARGLAAGEVKRRECPTSWLQSLGHPSLRTGCLLVPHDRSMGGIACEIQSRCLTTSSFNTMLTCYLIDGGTDARIVENIATEAKRRIALTRAVFRPEIPLQCGNGGFHVWLPMQREKAEEVVGHALKHSIALTPPSSMVTDVDDISGVRLCLGGPSYEDLAADLTALKMVIL